MVYTVRGISQRLVLVLYNWVNKYVLKCGGDGLIADIYK